ncbi:hypothetical protein GCM10009748_29180 [Agromyces lapidis]
MEPAPTASITDAPLPVRTGGRASLAEVQSPILPELARTAVLSGAGALAILGT